MGIRSVAQSEDAWVYFKDKPSAATFISDPLSMLSQRALDRRERFAIILDNKDVPIESSYLVIIQEKTGITVLARSKWLNAVHVRGSYDDIQQLLDLDFVGSIEFADNQLNNTSKPTGRNKIIKKQNKLKEENIFDYGNAVNQIEMLGIQELHNENFTGNGIYIAVLDAGFPGVNTLEAFERIRSNQLLKGGYNFVDRDDNFYARSTHGTAVLSTMAGFIENEFAGSAPDAAYYLFITEDHTREVPLEESLWVEAAEMADSLGVDIINTSLGYSVYFDNPDYNYSYGEMDGETAFISRGAKAAFSRGMLLVNSAGNEGNDPWKYINAPADVPEVLSVGAVDANEQVANFSSFGPTAKGIIKPDVLGQGAGIQIINAAGTIVASNGTSFSSPLMAGAVACLWQALPEKNNVQIIQLLRETGHLFESPTAQEGYGIPDFSQIFNLYYVPPIPVTAMNAYPNPTTGILRIDIPDKVKNIGFKLFNLLGKTVMAGAVEKGNPYIDISHVSKGIYILQMQYLGKQKTIKLIKR